MRRGLLRAEIDDQAATSVLDIRPKIYEQAFVSFLSRSIGGTIEYGGETMWRNRLCCGSQSPLRNDAAPVGDFLEHLKQTPLSEIHERLASLTAQERSILDLIVRGACNKEICKSLGIEVTTTKVHASRIFKKLGVKNRVQAAVLHLWASFLSGSSIVHNGSAAMPEPRARVRKSAISRRRPALLQRETTSIVAALPEQK